MRQLPGWAEFHGAAAITILAWLRFGKRRSIAPGESRTELALRLVEIAESHGVADLYAFGSRAPEIIARVGGTPTPNAPTGSDVDIGVRPKPGHLGHVDARVALALALEDLFDVPRVDLVILPEAPPFLALEIVRGELLYYAHAREQIEYELYLLRRAADLAPLERERRRLLIYGEA